MATKLSARIINSHDTEENWSKLTTFIPKSGEIIFFEPDVNCNYVRLKLGDGKTLLSDLPFNNDAMLDGVIKLEDEVGYLDSGNISDYSKRTLYKFTIMNTKCECVPKSTWSDWINSFWPKIAGFTAYSINAVNDQVIIEGNIMKGVTSHMLIAENGIYSAN